MENSINEKSNVNNIINKNIESENINKMLELIEYSIKEYKEIGETETDKNEIIEIKFLNKFIKEGNIKINDNDSFESFIKELIYLFNKGSNIFVPFLNICPILIEYYIKNDVDEGSEIEYLGIFKLLKINSFISREYLYPIYEYFSDLFYRINKIEENDKNFKKIHKVFELWKILYDFSVDPIKIKNFNSSSFCFIGGGLEANFRKDIILDNKPIIIKIEFLNNIIFKVNKDLIFFRIEDQEDNEKSFKIQQTSKGMENIINNLKEIDIIKIAIYLNKIKFQFYCGKDNYGTQFQINFESIKEFYLLENFYGQVKKIEITHKDCNKVFEPYLLKEDGNILSKDEKTNSLISIKLINKNLVKSNYINYLDKTFNLYEYFGGFIPFVPFIPLVNRILLNSKIKFVNGKNKTNFLKGFINDVISAMFIIIKKNKEFFSSYIKKYDLYFLFLIFQLDTELILPGTQNDNLETIFYSELIDSVNDYYNAESKIEYKLNKIKDCKNKEDFNNEIKPIIDIIIKKIVHDYLNQKNPLFVKTNYRQLSNHIMKELFIYNRFWSHKEFFFEDKDKDLNLKLKYKQLSYFTRNFQQPLLYPILEMDKYYPLFSRFEKKYLFKHELEEIVNYNFDFKNNKINKLVCKPLEEEANKIDCCLVKKIYHVKGELVIKKYKGNKNVEFIFCSYNGKNKETCNKKIGNNTEKKTYQVHSENDEICYGSIFPCPAKEFNRKIAIKLKDIKFILIRNYYRRTSAIEIFTFKSNKSYYFNFKTSFNLKNFNNNLILKEINNCNYFIKMDFNFDIIGGYYNKIYEDLMFPLFSEELKEWKNKFYYYNNYDLLILINLLANRSFKDLYQYPIFPILYKPNNILEKELVKERDLGQHLGLQEMNQKLNVRKKIIEETYHSSKGETEGENEDNDQVCLFNTHYSNPVYTCNYLIRIFPYSLACIEFQGDGFDSPNRLFFSVKKAMENTLNQKSDLREFIPEIYYFPDLYENKNELNLGVLIDGSEIDKISIKDKVIDDFEKYEFMAKLRNYFEFKKIYLNRWIDLIFGKFQKYFEEEKYFGEDKYIQFDKALQDKYTNNPIFMQKYEFGVQPLKLFNNKFPEIIRKFKYSEEIKKYNKNQFYKDHIVITNDQIICFKCEYDYNKSQDYLNRLKEDKLNLENEKSKKKINLFNWKKDKLFSLSFHYIFQGDIFGNVTIFKNESKFEKVRQNKNNSVTTIPKNSLEDFEENNINDKTNKINIDLNSDQNNDNIQLIENKKYKKIKKLTDHNKQIKYIDYNPRLNLFLSYSLDGFINIYVFPKCKLVRAIKTSKFIGSDDILQKVVLVSNPFPMIFTYDMNNMYVLSLNGELIKKEKLKENVEIYPCIDKDCGLVNDCIFIKNPNDKNLLSEEPMLEISLPFLSPESTEK